MKKLIVFILVTVLLCVAKFSFTEKLTIQNLFPSATTEVYVEESEVPQAFKSISNGSGSIIFCKAGELDYIKDNFNVVGYTLKVEGINKNDVYKLLKSSAIKSGNLTYGNSLLLPKGISFDGYNVNFQVKEGEGFALIGYPILLGSY